MASLTNASICPGARGRVCRVWLQVSHLQRAGRAVSCFAVFSCVTVRAALWLMFQGPGGHTLCLLFPLGFFPLTASKLPVQSGTSVSGVGAHCHIVLGQEWREGRKLSRGNEGLKKEETSHVCLRSGWSEARPMWEANWRIQFRSPGKAAWGLQGRRHGWCWGSRHPSVQA